MKVVEIFSSIEGEGIRAGFLCTFVRLYGCNMRCVYCDSMYANDSNNYTEMDIPTIVNKCKELKNYRITITGGEPLIHKQTKELINVLLEEGFEVNIETNGSINIKDFRNTDTPKLIFTVDYKVPYSGEESKMLNSNFFVNIKEWDVVKFVCANTEDLTKMMYIVNSMSKSVKLPHIFVSCVFGCIEPCDVVEFLKKHNLQNIRLQLQIHKYIWEPDKIGV